MLELAPKLKDVFLSHNSADHRLISRINEILRANGLDTFFDRVDIKPGANWIVELTEKAASSRIMMIFFTQSALKEGWMGFESQQALLTAVKDKTRRIVPVLLEGVTREETPAYLHTFQVLDLSEKNLSDSTDVEWIGQYLTQVISELLPEVGMPIPFVVFAMTKAEAVGLVKGDTLRNAALEDRDNFERLIARLDYSKDEIPDQYADLRDEWRPPFYSAEQGKTIRQTVNEVIRLTNESAREENSSDPRIYPQFFSTDFLSDDPQVRLKTYEFLKKRRFVLIIDSLSLFHPTLNRRLMIESGFGQSTSKTVRIVVPLPLRSEPLPSRQDIESTMQNMMLNLYNRYDTHLDTLYEFGISSERDLRRWIYSSLEREVSRSLGPGTKAEATTARRLRNQYGGRQNP
jgi:hypothetical protein